MFDLSLHIENLTTGDPQEQVPLPTWDHYLKVRNDAELAKVGNRLQTSCPLSSWYDMIVSANNQCHHQRWKCGFQRFHAEIEWRSEKIYFMAFLGLKQIFCDPRVPNSVDRVGDWEEEWANRVADAFEKLISENSKWHLNEIKKKEVNAIRRWVSKVQNCTLLLFLRRLMQGKKNQNQNNSELPTHLDMTVRERFKLLNLWSVEVFGIMAMIF